MSETMKLLTEILKSKNGDGTPSTSNPLPPMTNSTEIGVNLPGTAINEDHSGQVTEIARHSNATQHTQIPMADKQGNNEWNAEMKGT